MTNSLSEDAERKKTMILEALKQAETCSQFVEALRIQAPDEPQVNEPLNNFIPRNLNANGYNMGFALAIASPMLATRTAATENSEGSSAPQEQKMQVPDALRQQVRAFYDEMQNAIGSLRASLPLLEACANFDEQILDAGTTSLQRFSLLTMKATGSMQKKAQVLETMARIAHIPVANSAGMQEARQKVASNHSEIAALQQHVHTLPSFAQSFVEKGNQERRERELLAKAIGNDEFFVGNEALKVCHQPSIDIGSTEFSEIREELSDISEQIKAANTAIQRFRDILFVTAKHLVLEEGYDFQTQIWQ